MYGNPYYNQQAYEQDLINIIQNAQNKLNQINNKQVPQQQTPITQNFQLAPTQNSTGTNYAESIDDVKRELVFGETLFVNKNYSFLWVKNASGDIKTYQLKEVVELDEKDVKINALLARIEELERGNINELSEANVSVSNGTAKRTKSTNVSNDNSSEK